MEFGSGAQETAASVASGQEWQEVLERQIETKYGLHVGVEFHLTKARPQGVKNVDIARMVEEKLKMHVEIVDDGDDDEELF